MNRFSDKNGRLWSIELPFGAVIRIKKEHGIDLLNPADGDPSVFERVMFDYEYLFDCIWACVEPAAKSQNVTASEFGEAIAAECLISAKQAFLAEWRDFFQSLQRLDLVQALDKTIALQATAQKMVQEKLNPQAMQKLDAKVTAAMQAACDRHFGKLLEN